MVISEVGNYSYPAHFVPTNTVYFNSLDVNVDLRVVASFWTYVDTVSHDYNNPANWSNAGVPNGLQPDITVTGNLDIANNITFNSLLVDSGGSVTVTQNAKVTIAYETVLSESGEYGDLIVENGGELTVNTPLKVHDFILRSTPSDLEGIGRSGQVKNQENLEMVNGNVYFELHIPAQDGTDQIDEDQWYGFSVPFPVKLTNGGVARLEDDGNGNKRWNNQLIINDDYAIANYISSRRATGKTGWRQFSGQTLYPGNFYMLGIDTQARVYRFRMDDSQAWETNTELPIEVFTDPSNKDELGNHRDDDDNWNALANPNLLYSNTEYNSVHYAQIYLNGRGIYQTVLLDNTNFVVGMPFFIQSVERGTIMLNPLDEYHMSAPQRMSTRETGYHIITFARSNTPQYNDRVILHASEEAEDRYVMGEDMAKFEVTVTEPQMWIPKYNKRLSAHDAPLVNNMAIYPLKLRAPKADEYIIEQQMSQDNANVYLMHNGQIIWNLSRSAYIFDLPQGYNTEYSLLLLDNNNGAGTDIENILNNASGVEKIIMNNQLYILRNGMMYDATGNQVK